MSSGWVELAGNLWLFAGFGYGASAGSEGYLNDLWKYSISANTWTWISGSNQLNQGEQFSTGSATGQNVLAYPGAREASATGSTPREVSGSTGAKAAIPRITQVLSTTSGSLFQDYND